MTKALEAEVSKLEETKTSDERGKRAATALGLRLWKGRSFDGPSQSVRPAVSTKLAFWGPLTPAEGDRRPTSLRMSVPLVDGP